MPIYEFECINCHKALEVFLYGKEEAPTKCDDCGGDLKKLVSQAAFHLKGSGWYKDLYSSKKTEAPQSEKEEKKPTSEKKEQSGTPAASTPSTTPKKES